MNLICHNTQCKYCKDDRCCHPRKVINEAGTCDNFYQTFPNKTVGPRDKIYMDESETEEVIVK